MDSQMNKIICIHFQGIKKTDTKKDLRDYFQYFGKVIKVVIDINRKNRDYVRTGLGRVYFEAVENFIFTDVHWISDHRLHISQNVFFPTDNEMEQDVRANCKKATRQPGINTNGMGTSQAGREAGCYKQTDGTIDRETLEKNSEMRDLIVSVFKHENPKLVHPASMSTYETQPVQVKDQCLFDPSIAYYKTRQCKNMLAYGTCSYGSGCLFVHGDEDYDKYAYSSVARPEMDINANFNVDHSETCSVSSIQPGSTISCDSEVERQLIGKIYATVASFGTEGIALDRLNNVYQEDHSCSIMDVVKIFGCKGIVEMLEKKCQGWIRLKPSGNRMMLIPVERVTYAEQLKAVDEYYAERERKKKRRQSRGQRNRQNFIWNPPVHLNQPAFPNFHGALMAETESTHEKENIQSLDDGLLLPNWMNNEDLDGLHGADAIEAKDMNSRRSNRILKVTQMNEAPPENWVYTVEFQQSILEQDRKKPHLNLGHEQEEHRCTLIAQNLYDILMKEGSKKTLVDLFNLLSYATDFDEPLRDMFVVIAIYFGDCFTYQFAEENSHIFIQAIPGKSPGTKIFQIQKMLGLFGSRNSKKIK